MWKVSDRHAASHGMWSRFMHNGFSLLELPAVASCLSTSISRSRTQRRRCDIAAIPKHEEHTSMVFSRIRRTYGLQACGVYRCSSHTWLWDSPMAHYPQPVPDHHMLIVTLSLY
ncbi:hypothetical protein BDV06DRAFT_195611 [Aspergillus oleicola]